MVADFLVHDVYTDELGDKTQYEYTTTSTSSSRSLATPTGRSWRRDRFGNGCRSGQRRRRGRRTALYRTARAFFGKIRLCYRLSRSSGLRAGERQPFGWASTLVCRNRPSSVAAGRHRAFVELADDDGQPSIGDAIVIMSWLGVRRQDWLEWPADVFDRDLVAFSQEKTDIPNVLPWSLVPELVQRVAAAKARRADAAVSARTFFHDRHGRPWKDAETFRRAFNKIRANLVQKYGSFATRYYVGLVDGDPLAVPTAELTMRTMRHTCVTLNFDAGVPPKLIGGITGHSPDEIDDILAHYRARTADQATAALELRMAHEAKSGG